MRNFAPQSRDFNERATVRAHRSFADGLSLDLPKSSRQIRSGLTRLENGINYGDRIGGRGGSRAYTSSTAPGGDIPRGNCVNKFKGLYVLHEGNSLWISSTRSMDSAAEAVAIGTPIDDVVSDMDVYQNFVFIFCNKRIFRLDLTAEPYVYWQINTPVPTTLITGVAGNAHTYRYWYGMCRLSGSGWRTRFSYPLVSVRQQGGATLFDGQRDYGEVTTDTEIDTDNPLTVATFEYPQSCEWATHVSIARTKNLGDAGVDPVTAVKNKEYEITLANDVPLAKAYIGSVDASGIMTIIRGRFEVADIGNTIIAIDGVTAGKIASVVSTSQAQITDADGDPWSGGAVATTAWSFGGGDLFRITINAGTIKRMAGDSFTADMIGKPFFLDYGSEIWVKEYVDSDTLIGHDSAVSSSTVMAATINPVSRVYTDDITDDVLRSRETAYPLRTRLFEPLTCGDTGAIAFGFICCANHGEHEIQYSELTKWYEETAGYFQPDVQTAYCEDEIWAVRAMPNQFDVKCANSTYALYANTVQLYQEQKTGQSFRIFAQLTPIDPAVGTKAWKTICSIPGGLQVLITSGPGIQLFDGLRYQGNLADNRIMSILTKLDPRRLVGAYSDERGFQFWTTQPSGIDEQGDAANTIDESGDRETLIVERGV